MGCEEEGGEGVRFARHETKWCVYVGSDAPGGHAVEARCASGEEAEEAMGYLARNVAGFSGAMTIPPFSMFVRRDLPIYGETPIDAELRKLRRTPLFGDYFAGAASDGLSFTVDSQFDPGCASIDDLEEMFEDALTHEQLQAAKDGDITDDESEDDWLEMRRSDIAALYWEFIGHRETWLLKQIRRFTKNHQMRKHDMEHRCLVVAPVAPPETPGVYVIQGVGDFVKIGKAKNIRHRMKEIQLAHPVPLRLLAVLDADPSAEGRYHQEFRHLRAHGEWFRYEGTLRAAVTEARSR